MKKLFYLFYTFSSLSLLFISFSYANDIRTLGIGVDVNGLEMRGYKNLVCLENKKNLDSWSDYNKCKKNKEALYTVSFEYDDRYAVTEEFEGTQIAGHPVLINVGINSDNLIEQINVKTDPTAPWYFKKQSYLLWLRIYNKYGSSGWKCTEKEPKQDHLIVGKKYINKICVKEFETKKVILHSEFYFKNNKKDKDNLVSRTFMKIEKYPKT